MQVHFGLDSLRAEWPQAVACIGTFDGVHLGHRAVISQAVSSSRQEELPCVLVTFDRHPAAILDPARCPKAIASLRNNLNAFDALGVSVAVVLRFDAELSRMTADAFLDDILRGQVRATSLVVGHDFAMGNARVGTAAWLSDRIPTLIVPPFVSQGERVSSTLVRERVLAGDMERASQLLGRPFELPGVVVAGQQLGRQLGYPTANVARSFDQILPPDGVYAGRARGAFGDYAAAIAIGVRPTVNGEGRTIEAFLLDYDGGSLYGASIKLDIVHRLREERHFPTLEALIEQMGRDVEQVRLLSRVP